MTWMIAGPQLIQIWTDDLQRGTCEVLFNDTTLSWWWWQRVRDPSAGCTGCDARTPDALDATEIVWLVCYKDVISLWTIFLRVSEIEHGNSIIVKHGLTSWLPASSSCSRFRSALRDPEDKQHDPKLGRQLGLLGGCFKIFVREDGKTWKFV